MAKSNAHATSDPERVGFFLLPMFQLLGFSAAMETLRVANMVSGQTLYAWTVVSADGMPVVSSSGTAVTPDAGIAAVDRFPTMIICGGRDSYGYRDRRVFAWLRKLARSGAMLGAIGPGVFALARAGLLDGYRCTLHWEDFEALSREFPRVRLSSAVFEVDRDRMTCPGYIAPIDMMLNLIETRHGQRLATDVASGVLQYRLRDHADTQRMSPKSRFRISDPRLLAAIEAMESHLEKPLTLPQLSQASGLSHRHMQRRFSEALGCTPTEFYRELRLQQARKMLMRGTRSILDVAVATGFASGSHFSRSYRAHFGHSPREDRTF